MSAVAPKATILIVDDEPDNRFALSHVLAELEQRIVEAASGADALRFLLRDSAEPSCSTQTCRAWTATRPPS